MKHINNLIFLALVGLMASGAVYAMGEDDPFLTYFQFDRFEKQFTDGSDPLVIEASAWLGRDLSKFWVKTDYERVNGRTEENEWQLLYGRAVAPFWDLQAGWRGDLGPGPNRQWLVLGASGTAPYEIETDAALFAGESGRLGARLSAEYEYMLTQRLVLSPEMELNVYSKDDEALGVGSGLSDLELGLRLRYHISREFAPYIGLNWQRKLGQTADFARDDGEDVDDAQFVTGFRAWF